MAVLGDLNGEVQAAATQILLGPPGSEIGTPGYDRPDDGDAARRGCGTWHRSSPPPSAVHG